MIHKCLISYKEISVSIPTFPYTKTLNGCQLDAEYRYFHAISSVSFLSKS
jgi:hypothetical protein